MKKYPFTFFLIKSLILKNILLVKNFQKISDYNAGNAGLGIHPHIDHILPFFLCLLDSHMLELSFSKIFRFLIRR